MVALPPERLGSFFLGAEYDTEKGQITTESVNYDSRDLTTHAVCVGMTGSGKTGLCIGLLEEAAIDKVPALIIDPKGDMTNLMLQFDSLAPEEFKKWINPDDASRKGLTLDEYATAIAKKWKDGLADWGQGIDRIKMLKETVDYTIYTPGSDAGIPINILGSFKAPEVDFDSDAEMLRERIQGIVTALMGMLELDKDPVRSREGILLATLIEHYWRKKEDLDLLRLIKGVQNPPMSQLGVFEVDTFFPEKDRFELAMSFNSLVASPQFQYWLKGQSLDIDELYFTSDGKPRHSIFYIAHLSDSERMFFVTLLLNSLITWMRRQSGTTSLRSLLYFDEIFGYFPPTAAPPSKKPLLTILKQARAFGVGAILVTQNPVDIDYKGLSNAGTWFIGKLQTERDKERVLDGLKGALAQAGGNVDMDFDTLISSLKSRVFLLHNVHDSSPIVYHTRWAMSYLRGPLTRPQVKELMSSKKPEEEKFISIKYPSAQQDHTVKSSAAPTLDPSIPVKFLPVWKSMSEAKREFTASEDLKLMYKAGIAGMARVRFVDSKRKIDHVENKGHLSGSPDDFGRIDWSSAQSIGSEVSKMIDKPDHPEGIETNFQAVPDSMNSLKELNGAKKEYSNWLYQNSRLEILEHDDLEVFQQHGESKQAFLGRLEHKSREMRDEELDKIQEKYAPKFERIEDRIRKEEQDLEEAKADARDRKTQELVGVAETIFSVFVKKRSRSFSSAASRRRMTRKAGQKVEESEEDLQELSQDMADLEAQLEKKIEEIKVKWDTVSLGVTTREVKPRKADVLVDQAIFIWEPYWYNSNGEVVTARG